MASTPLLMTPADVTATLERSNDRPVLIFKHSLTCPISADAYREYQLFLGQEGGSGRFEHRLIEVQNARAASGAVAEATGIRHESPQAILLAQGRPVWNASHGRITRKALSDAVAALP